MSQFVRPNIVSTLVERFRETHKLKLISEIGLIAWLRWQGDHSSARDERLAGRDYIGDGRRQFSPRVV
jgi:hypothetical protein